MWCCVKFTTLVAFIYREIIFTFFTLYRSFFLDFLVQGDFRRFSGILLFFRAKNKKGRIGKGALYLTKRIINLMSEMKGGY